MRRRLAIAVLAAAAITVAAAQYSSGGWRGRGKASSYIARFEKTLRSWFSYNGLDVRLKVSVRGEHETPTITDERVPSKEELDRALRMATPRARVSIALMAFSRLRPQSLGNYTGTDGIKLGDFVEAEVNEEGITFTKVPAMLVVRRELSKARHQYLQFIMGHKGDVEARYSTNKGVLRQT